MSIELMAVVWREFSGHPTAKLILLSLADQANNDGWSWPSQTHTAQRCMISERQARSWIHKLSTAGWLEIHKRPGKSDMYRVIATPEAHFRGTPEADFRPPRKPTSGHPGSPLPPNHKEPSKNPKENPTHATCPYCRKRFSLSKPHDCSSMNQRIR